MSTPIDGGCKTAAKCALEPYLSAYGRKPGGRPEGLPLEIVHFSGGRSGDVSAIGGIDAEMSDHIRILGHFFA